MERPWIGPITKMTDRARPDLIAALRARLARRGVEVDGALPDCPVEAVRVDAVPYVGNMHFPMGRVARRVDVERRFRSLTF